MPQEFFTYLKLIIVLILFWLTGSFVDSALWFHTSYNTPAWVVSRLDIFWLFLSQFLFPFLMVLVLKPKLNTVIAFASAACFGSVVWDLVYSLLTRGTLISDSMERWFVLNDLDLILGVSVEYVWIFHIARIILGGILLYYLIRRLRSITATRI